MALTLINPLTTKIASITATHDAINMAMRNTPRPKVYQPGAKAIHAHLEVLHARLYDGEDVDIQGVLDRASAVLGGINAVTI